MTLKQLKSHEHALTNMSLQWREQLSFLTGTWVESKENEECCTVVKVISDYHQQREFWMQFLN